MSELILRITCAILIVAAVFLLAKWRMEAERASKLSLALGEVLDSLKKDFIPIETLNNAKKVFDEYK